MLCDERLADSTDMKRFGRASMTIYAVSTPAIALKISGDAQRQVTAKSSVESKASCSCATGSIECDPLRPRFLSAALARAFSGPVPLSSLCRQAGTFTG